MILFYVNNLKIKILKILDFIIFQIFQNINLSHMHICHILFKKPSLRIQFHPKDLHIINLMHYCANLFLPIVILHVKVTFLVR